MAIQQRYCVNDPQRLAIGVCLMTRKAICDKCSTRYEGVNYNREGLLLLQQQRAAAAQRAARAGAAGRSIATLLGTLLRSAMLYLVYLAYLTSADVVTSMLQRGQ